MGDDLVQRLRDAVVLWPKSSRGYYRDQIAIITDASDEIERLRAEVAWLRARVERADTAERDLAELRERIEKAPVRKVISDGQYDYVGCSGLDLLGHHVRLVRED